MIVFCRRLQLKSSVTVEDLLFAYVFVLELLLIDVVWSFSLVAADLIARRNFVALAF